MTEEDKPIPHELASYGFGEIFGAAGVESCSWGGGTPRAVPPGSTVSTEPFARWDVKTVLEFNEGEPDNDSWSCLVELNDGRWAYLDGSCDYTGFD